MKQAVLFYKSAQRVSHNIYEPGVFMLYYSENGSESPSGDRTRDLLVSNFLDKRSNQMWHREL